MFELVDNFFKENGLQWSKLVGCSIDCTPAMHGRKSGFQAHVKAVSSFVIFCSLLYTPICSCS